MNLETNPDRLRASNPEVIPSELARFCNAMSDGVRTQIIGTLMSGAALPASQIANELRMSPQATRFHLRVLEDAGLITARACGRHRYYEIASDTTADRLESIFGIVGPPIVSSRSPVFSADFAEARCCYKHLAGAMAVEFANSLQYGGYLSQDGELFRLELRGQQLFRNLGISTAKDRNGLVTAKRCIDVTHRRAHIGGALGAAILTWTLEKGWLRKKDDNRALVVTPQGRIQIRRLLKSIESGDAQ